MSVNKLSLRAKDLGLTDLDEYSPCAKFAEIIRERSEQVDLNEIELNLEFCWVEYSFTHIFLDEALRRLSASSSAERTLIIVVSINLGEPQFMAALLFRLSKLVNRDSEGSPEAILRCVEQFCINNRINLRIQSKIVLDGLGETSTENFYIGSNGGRP